MYIEHMENLRSPFSISVEIATNTVLLFNILIFDVKVTWWGIVNLLTI